MELDELNQCFEYLSLEAKELYLFNDVPVLEMMPTPQEFYREFVCPNRPVILKNAIRHWPACQKWTVDYLREKIGSKVVTVAVTPNGLADAVIDDYFMTPHEETMLVSAFLDILFGKVRRDGIYYIQKQNSNLTDEFCELLMDVDPHVAWATESFGKEPDAVNFWMGDERAVTSMHKDHYENIYCVISGFKDFILHPPTDLPWIPYDHFPVAQYQMEEDGSFRSVTLEGVEKVPWIPLDPLKPDLASYPDYSKATAIHCRINAGDALYLPSLWFHHVRQSHGCIAVNYWYDMNYDIKYNYFKFVEMLLTKLNNQH